MSALIGPPAFQLIEKFINHREYWELISWVGRTVIISHRIVRSGNGYGSHGGDRQFVMDEEDQDFVGRNVRDISDIPLG